MPVTRQIHGRVSVAAYKAGDANDRRPIMRFFIKEWPDQTATLMTDEGQVIWTFDSVASALRGGIEWAGIEAEATPCPSVPGTPPFDVAA